MNHCKISNIPMQIFAQKRGWDEVMSKLGKLQPQFYFMDLYGLTSNYDSILPGMKGNVAMV